MNGFALTSVLLFVAIVEHRVSEFPRNEWQLPTAPATSIATNPDSVLTKSKAAGETTASASPGSAPALLTRLLDLPEPPPPQAYAVTGKLLPPFLMAVLSAWRREFPDIPLSENGVIFVIRPGDFYVDLDPEQARWLTSREMLGIQNFPLIINPLTPGDDWYLRAQREWKQGNDDAIFVLLTSLYHEIAHSRRSEGELSAYKGQLELFETFQKRGKLASPYARGCYKVLRERYLDLTKHPDEYVQMIVRLGNRTTAILLRPRGK